MFTRRRVQVVRLVLAVAAVIAIVTGIVGYISNTDYASEGYHFGETQQESEATFHANVEMEQAARTFIQFAWGGALGLLFVFVIAPGANVRPRHANPIRQ